jgi:hypothetical protein
MNEMTPILPVPYLPSFIDQPDLLLGQDEAGSRIEVRTYAAGKECSSVDMRVNLMTTWPTVLSWTLSLTPKQAVEFADRVRAAALVSIEARLRPVEVDVVAIEPVRVVKIVPGAPSVPVLQVAPDAPADVALVMAAE